MRAKYIGEKNYEHFMSLWRVEDVVTCCSYLLLKFCLFVSFCKNTSKNGELFIVRYTFHREITKYDILLFFIFFLLML